MTDMTTAAVHYLRRQLVNQAAAHGGQADVYTGLVHQLSATDDDTPTATAVRAAWLGHAMAANYAYSLAGALRLIEIHAGTELATRIAIEIRAVLDDGDESNLNADLDEQ